MVGVLLFRDEKFNNKLVDQTEKLFNHINDIESLQNIKSELNLSDDQIQEIIKLIPEKYTAFEELFKILPDLKKKYKLAVINNGPAITLKYFKSKFGFDKYFDLFINSTEVGIKKPDPKIFLLTCEKLEVSPEDCIFSDDKLENVDSAKELGMQTIWWDRNIDKTKHLQVLIKLLTTK